MKLSKMISRRVYVVKQPDPITRDSRGTLIEPDLRIAFNRSGDIKLGRIVSIKKNLWEVARGRYMNVSDNTPKHWCLNFVMEVIGEDEKISVLSNPNSFVII